MAVAIFLNHLKRSFTLVTDPYFLNQRMICGTALDGTDVCASPGDAFGIDACDKLDFFLKVKESFISPVYCITKALFPGGIEEHSLSICNGVCTFHYDNNIKYSVQYTLEKGIKLNNDIYTVSDIATNTQMVRTVDSAKRKDRYFGKVPQGKSYDRIIVCLQQFGSLTTAEIANKVGVPENRISGRISEMCKCGLIRKNGTKTIDGRRQTLWTLIKKSKNQRVLDRY